jgi:hypothetical protein
MSNTPLKFASQVSGTIEKTLAPNKTGVSTTETAFLVNGNAIANISPFVLPVSVGTPGVFLAGAPGALSNTGQVFRLRAYGFAVTGATENLTLNLYQVPAASIAGLTATSFAGATKIATTGAVAVNSTIGSFLIDVVLQAVAESASAATLQGYQFGYVNNGGSPPTVTGAAPITPVTGLLGEGDLNFFVTSTLSGGNAADVVTLSGLQLEFVS